MGIMVNKKGTAPSFVEFKEREKDKANGQLQSGTITSSRMY